MEQQTYYKPYFEGKDLEENDGTVVIQSKEDNANTENNIQDVTD